MSTLSVSNITDGVDTVETGYVVNGSAKAWVNLNGTGTIAIRDSLNVSGLVDVGVGTYQVNYTNAMTDGNNSVVAGVSTDNAGSYNSPIVQTTLSTSTNVQSRPDQSSSTGDSPIATAHTMGDLA